MDSRGRGFTRGRAWAAAMAWLALAACGISAFAADIASVTPVPQSGDPGSWWQKRFAAKLAEAKAGGAPIVFLGDSITHNWESRGRVVWEDYFATGRYRALNAGFSADRTEHLLWRLDHGMLDGFKARAVVLMIGTNNTGHRTVDAEPPIDTIIGIRAVLLKIREKQPDAKIILHPIFPRGRFKDDPLRVRNMIVNKEIRHFADGKDVWWCDFNDQLLDAEGRLPREIMQDYLHPNAYGYEVWANALLPYLDAALDGIGDRKMPQRLPASADAAVFGNASLACVPQSIIGHRYTWNKAQWWWLDRMAEKRRQVASSGGSIDIVFVGDSITHNWESRGRSGTCYTDLQKEFSILNLGYSGDSTQHALWRLKNGELAGYKAKVFMVMIGTNNNMSEDLGKPENVSAAIREIVETIRSRQPQAKVLLLPVFPRRPKPTDPARLHNAEVSRLIRPLADGKDVIWCDFTDKLLTPDGVLTKEIMPDSLHPAEPGYRIWMEACLPYFRKFCGKAPPAK